MSLASEAFAKAAYLVRRERRLAQSKFSDKLGQWRADAAMILMAAAGVNLGPALGKSKLAQAMKQGKLRRRLARGIE